MTENSILKAELKEKNQQLIKATSYAINLEKELEAKEKEIDDLKENIDLLGQMLKTKDRRFTEAVKNLKEELCKLCDKINKFECSHDLKDCKIIKLIDKYFPQSKKMLKELMKSGEPL